MNKMIILWFKIMYFLTTVSSVTVKYMNHMISRSVGNVLLTDTRFYGPFCCVSW